MKKKIEVVSYNAAKAKIDIIAEILDPTGFGKNLLLLGVLTSSFFLRRGWAFGLL